MSEILGWANSLGAVAAVNLVVWTGLFLYLLWLAKQIREKEKGQ